MNQRTKKYSSQNDPKKATTRSKKWYHLKLFPKFALIFFLVVALPVVVIAINVSYQSKAIILESIKGVIEDITTSIETITQRQQETNETILDSTGKELIQINKQSLSRTKDRLSKLNKSVYEENIGNVVSESQVFLEQQFHLLNAEIAQEIVTSIDGFVRDSRIVMRTLADSAYVGDLYPGMEKQFKDVLSFYEQFVHLRYVDNSELNTPFVTRKLAFYKESDPALTPAESSLSSAFSGEEAISDGMTKDGFPVLQVFVPVNRERDTVGVIFGVLNVLPLWNRIQGKFFNHGEQIYIVNAQGALIYPLRDLSVSPTMVEHLQQISRASESQGTAQQKEVLLSFATLSMLDWKVVVAQPTSFMKTIVASMQTTISEHVKQIDEQVQVMLAEEETRITQNISEGIEKRKQNIRQTTVGHRESFCNTMIDLLTDNINLIADEVHKKTLRNIVPIILGIGILAIAAGILVAGRIIKPIKEVTAMAYNISQGNVSQTVPIIHSHDEIKLLSRSFEATTTYLRNIAKGAQKISEGEFTDEVKPLSENDALGVAFKNMTAYLRDIAALATNISHGDLSRIVTPKSEVDVLGHAVYRMTVYLQRIAHVAKKVAGGNLSENSQPQSEKDFLGNAFTEMIVKLRHLVSRIRGDASQLVIMSQESQDRAQEEADSVERISLSVENTSASMTEMAMSIGEVNESMQGLASFVGETMSSIEEMTSSIRQIVMHSEQLASASEETSVSIQEISASLRQIAETAQHSKTLSDGARQDAIDGREAVERMIQSMKVIQHMISVTAEAIGLLNKRTESIETILEVIKDISEQTSLLAINASIIAKKAGQRGRGFNVIAAKVRKLADQSSSSAKEIAMIIKDVRKESAHAVEVVTMGDEKVREGVNLAELAGKALDKIILGANESSSVVARIAETTKEQTKISHSITESMERVVDMVDQIKRATKEQEKSSSFIVNQAEQILLASQQVKQSTLEQTDVVKHVSLAMDDIRGLIEMTSDRAKESARAASTLAQHANALQQLVSQFTI